MNITINQSTANQEIVNSNIISKLYNLISENSQHNVTPSGNLYSATGYKQQIDALVERFSPNLIITVPVEGQYLIFEDPQVENILKNIIGDGVGITGAAAANATFTTGFFENNTDITSFNTFNLFTKANTNPPVALFKGCTNLASVNLSNIATIGEDEFYNCNKLNVSLNSSGLTSLGYRAFYNSGITSITNLGSITSIPDECFRGCTSLTSVTLPSSVTSIGRWGFADCHMTTMDLSHVTSLGVEAFINSYLTTADLSNISSIGEGCFSGTRLQGALNMPNLISLGGIAFANTNITSVNDLGNLTSLEPRTFQNCTSLVSADLSNITSFGWSSFSGCSNLVLDVATLSTNITFIGEEAFNGCTKVTGVLNLPNLTRMDSNAFRATGITSITSLGNLTSTPTWGFQNCPSLTNVTLPSGLTTIGRNCFEGDTSLTSINLSNVTNIEMSAFVGCTSLGGTINLPNLTGVLGMYAFASTHISSISSLGSVTEIQERVFENTDISSITIPNSVKKCNCTLVNNTIVPEIIFPEGVEEILGGQFYTKNNSLTYIEIPSTVTNMDIFFHRTIEYSQNDLCTLVIKATTPPALNYYAVWAVDATRGDKFAGIYVPDASLTAYQNGANAWQHSSIQAKLKPISQLQTDNPTAWAKYNRTSTV